jgi:hypothetical protein
LATNLSEQMDADAESSQDQRENELPHSGTESHVPIRDVLPDSYFTPTFITQLLGQLMPDPERENSGALGAYKALYARIRNYDRSF